MKKIILVLIFALIFAAFAAGSDPVVVYLLNQDPDPAIAGEIVEVRLGVDNIGGTAIDNFILEFSPGYPFEQVSGELLVKQLGKIDKNVVGDNMKIVKFKVRVNKDATAGSYNLAMFAYEEGKRNPEIKQHFSIDVESKESAEVIYIDKVELIPGKITPMKFTINNVGSTPLRELTFKWENEEDIILPVGSDNTKYVKYIDVGDSAELEFDVIASTNADPDLYKLDLTLLYEDPVTGEEKEINTKAGVYVGGATDFDVAFSGVSSSEYSFSISNIGSVSASSVTVKIPQQTGWRVSGSNSVIIGNLNEGDYTIASFVLQSTQRNISRNQSTQIEPSVDIEIQYTDTRGNRNSITKEVPVSLFSASDATTIPISFQGARIRQQQSPLQQLWIRGRWFIIGGIAVFVMIILRHRYKKGKMNDPKYNLRKLFRDVFSGKKKTR